MSHIHTKPGQHDHTVSGFIIRTDLGEPKLILHKHKKLGVYLQFGGHIELHENPWQALTHELLEESGYELKQLKILQPKSRMRSLSHSKLHPQPVCHNTHKFNDKHSHIDSSYAFVTDQDPNKSVAEGESNKTKLITREELASLPSSEVFEGIREAGLFVFDECLASWDKVPSTEFS